MTTLEDIERKLAELDGKPCKCCGKMVFWDDWSLNGRMCRECRRKFGEAGNGDSDAGDRGNRAFTVGHFVESLTWQF